MKVQNFLAKNQFVITDNKYIIFQSYESNIAKIENGCLTFGQDWNYSRTTLKFLYEFLKTFNKLLAPEMQKKLDFLYVESSKIKKPKELEKLIDNNIIQYDTML